MQRLQVIIYANAETRSQNRKAFERIVDCPQSITINLLEIDRVLRFLFGGAIIVSFNLSTL